MSTLFKQIVDQNIEREERVLIAERRAKDKLLDKQSNDLKIDVNLELNQSAQRKRENKNLSISHVYTYEDLEPHDVLLMQVPNINESGYYSGIVALKSYMQKYNSDISVKIIDPVIDYFHSNPPNKESEFFRLFNTYSEQGNFSLLYEHDEIYDIVENFISKYIEKGNPKFLGFSIIDGNIDATLAISKLVKEKWPDVKLVLGGNGVQMMNNGYLPSGDYNFDFYYWLDYIIRGDGEHTFVELVESDQTPESLMKIKGLIWQRGKEEISNQKYKFYEISGKTIKVTWVQNFGRENTSLDILPYPDYSDLQENFYYKKSYGDSIPLIFSRGCPYRCTFCSVPQFIPLFRYRPLDNVLEEMESWVEQNKRGFFCHDSIVNGDPSWTEKLCNAIIDKGWGDGFIKWGGNFRLQKPMRDIETLKLYNKAGVEWMITGLESASEPVLKHMKKYGSIQGTREIFENIREVNKNNERPIKVMLQLIIGYLNEGEEDFQKTMDFVEEFHDCIHEVLTCSAFLLWWPLKLSWEEEGNFLKFKNAAEWETEYSTTSERLDRLNRIEKLFKKLDIPHNIYNRGLYEEELAK